MRYRSTEVPSLSGSLVRSSSSIVSFFLIITMEIGCSLGSGGKESELEQKTIVERELVFTSLGESKNPKEPKSKKNPSAPLVKIKLPGSDQKQLAAKHLKQVATEFKTHLRTDQQDDSISSDSAKLFQNPVKPMPSDLSAESNAYPTGQTIRAADWRVRTGWYYTEATYPDPLSAQIAKGTLEKQGYKVQLVEIKESSKPFTLLVGPYYSKSYAKAETLGLLKSDSDKIELANESTDRSGLVFVGH